MPTADGLVRDTEPASPAHDLIRLDPADTARVLGTVIAPALAAGLIKRRPRLMRLIERLRLDRTAIDTMRRLRDRLGPGPVTLRIPGRSFLLPLSEVDAGRVLAGTPDPFTPATTEKRAALRQFQPHAVLISDPAQRPARRAFNERVLQSDRPLHELAPRIVDVVSAEAGALLEHTELDWDTFNRQWWMAVRRIVLGDTARDDERLTDLLGTLRASANWALPHPSRRRDRFLTGVADYVRRAEPGSLAGQVATTEAPAGVDRAGQVPHWLFAFDAAGMVTFRTLALLARHPGQLRGARTEIDEADLTRPQQLPYLRACVLDTVRLWPTTPAVLRETVRDTGWGPAGTSTVVYAPFFHRDPRTLPCANSFAPRIWLDGTAAAHPALVPFSAGPGTCPGRSLVLLTTSTMLAAILRRHDVVLRDKPGIDPERPLPATLDNFSLRLDLKQRSDR